MHANEKPYKSVNLYSACVCHDETRVGGEHQLSGTSGYSMNVLCVVACTYYHVHTVNTCCKASYLHR